jgi:DMSO reductase anchor subunit
MGYQVARRHADKLRIYAQGLGFLLPAVLLAAGMGLGTTSAAVTAVGASMSVGIGLLIERWLVFAQARHVMTLFYGR